MKDHIVQLMMQLANAALVLSAKMEQITGKFVVEPDDQAREMTDNLVRAAVAFTCRLFVLSKLETVDSAATIERKLIVSYRGESAPNETSKDFERAAGTLAESARGYAYALVQMAEEVQGGREHRGALKDMYAPSRKLANAAIALTVQLIFRQSDGSDRTRETLSRTEKLLTDKINEAYGVPSTSTRGKRH